jgi:hypothetical protein
MARGNNSKVSVAAFERTCEDFHKRFLKIESALSGVGKGTSLKDIKEEAAKTIINLNKIMEKKIGLLEKKVNKLEGNVKKKVSVTAWNKSIDDVNENINKVLSQNLQKVVEDLNEKLDKSADLINELMIHLNEKVSISAWEKSCVDIDKVASEVRTIKATIDDLKTRFLGIENEFKRAIVNEKEVKEWLKSI